MSVKAPLEQDIVKACLAYLHFRGVVAWRQNQGARPWTDRRGKARVMRFTSMNGISDILGLLPRGSRRPGVLLAVEVKRAGGTPEPHQQHFLDVIEDDGGVSCCVHSLDELRAVIDPLLEV